MVKKLKIQTTTRDNGAKSYSTNLDASYLRPVMFVINAYPKEIRPIVTLRDERVEQATVRSYIDIHEPEDFSCKLIEHMLSCETNISGLSDDIPMLITGAINYFHQTRGQP